MIWSPTNLGHCDHNGYCSQGNRKMMNEEIYNKIIARADEHYKKGCDAGWSLKSKRYSLGIASHEYGVSLDEFNAYVKAMNLEEDELARMEIRKRSMNNLADARDVEKLQKRIDELESKPKFDLDSIILGYIYGKELIIEDAFQVLVDHPNIVRLCKEAASEK